MIDACDQEDKAKLVFTNDHEDKEKLKRFSHFERCLMISVLEECINKLVIVGAARLQYASNSNFEPISIRLGNKHVNMVYDLFTHVLIPESTEKLREIKFQRERELIVKVLSLVRAELIELGEIHSIYAYLAVDNHCRLENISIADQYRKNVFRLDEIKLLFEKIRKDTAHTANDQEIEIEEKKKELDLFKKLALTQMIYNCRWQSARYDQNKALIERRIRKLQEEIDFVDNKTEIEYRVHKEISNYLAIATKQIEQDVIYWNNLYRKDIAKIEMNTMNIESNIEKATLHLDLTERATKVEEEHLKELKKEKEEREARLIIEKLREDCATKIQSWWRGTMVRWEFGKYCEIMKKKFKKQKKPKK
ncbi:dynein regulatory complex protein 9 [Rhodnius prolixus]|uniref:dynein regulatory complex protein 9 n=1 Tax=Rhodnius prolixus TaxID=13249 RepID=UPI003D18AF4D